ncbi:hypothetical protein E3N88_33056 [Mikania micrantha]|uniref:CCHC-type domain-containing protein n=1 Tax=Mikania micrantha TaxID=192012 RepID=A0A5N6MAU2_9ASTR|nr:hypothetical protein E3N88_33056 [Mikania micrantha]
MSASSSSHPQYYADESGYVMGTPSRRVDTESEPEEDPEEVSSSHTRSTTRTPVAREPTPPPPLPAPEAPPARQGTRIRFTARKSTIMPRRVLLRTPTPPPSPPVQPPVSDDATRPHASVASRMMEVPLPERAVKNRDLWKVTIPLDENQRRMGRQINDLYGRLDYQSGVATGLHHHMNYVEHGQRAATTQAREAQSEARMATLVAVNIQVLIDQHINAALPNIITQEVHHNVEGGGVGNAARRGCTYKEFMACKPKDFYGNEGAVGLLRWIEKMEAVIDISDCADRNKIKFAAGSFQGKALTWWNTQVQARGREAAMGMTWAEFTELLIREYCPRNEIQKIEHEFWNLTMIPPEIAKYVDRFHELAKMVPHLVTPEPKRIERFIWGLAPQIRGMVQSASPTTLQAAIHLSFILTDDMLRTGVFVKANPKDKRKNQDNGNKSEAVVDKKAKTVKNYVANTQAQKPYSGPHPKCNKCNYHHPIPGNCFICNNCHRLGHIARYCRAGNIKNPQPVNAVNPTGNQRACYQCGSTNHFRNTCPQLNRAPENAGNQPPAIEEHSWRSFIPPRTIIDRIIKSLIAVKVTFNTDVD